MDPFRLLYFVLLTISLISAANGEAPNVVNAANKPADGTENKGSSFEDNRCKCVCPSPQVVTNETSSDAKRRLYVGNVEPDQCTCDNVVLPKLDMHMQLKAKEFCPRCECKYQNRNTRTIKWVVILIVVVMTGLVIYMAFLMFFDPYLHKNTRTMYQEHVDEVVLEEQVRKNSDMDSNNGRRRLTTVSSAESATSAAPKTRNPRDVLRRVEEQQSKWKKQIIEQRKNIYDKHTMLN